MKHFVLCSRIHSKKWRNEKAFFIVDLLEDAGSATCTKKGEPEPRGFEKVIVHMSQQTALLSKTCLKSVFSCAPLLLLFLKKLTLFGGPPDKKRWMSF